MVLKCLLKTTKNLVYKMIPYYIPPKIVNSDSLDKMFKDIKDTRSYTKGKYSIELEKKFTETYNINYAISCGSGTQGLWLILNTLKPKTILVPSFEWKSIVPLLNNCNVFWGDIDKDTWLLQETKNSYDAILFNQTFGNVGYIQQDFKGHRIYDLAQSFGAKLSLSKSDVGVFSLSGTKNITSGEGGMIVTDSKELYQKLVEQRNLLSRLSELQAILGIHYLDSYKQVSKRKTQIYNYYKSCLPFKFQKILYSHSYSVIGCCTKERNKIISYLKDRVEFKVYYEPISPLPNTQKIYSEIICLPCYSDVNEFDVVTNVLEAMKLG